MMRGFSCVAKPKSTSKQKSRTPSCFSKESKVTKQTQEEIDRGIKEEQLQLEEQEK